MKSLLVILFLVKFLFSSTGFVFADVLVTLPNGQIRGHELTTDDNKTFYGFHGIPYAAPPIGSLRFQAPIPAENWEGIWDATKDRDDCINKTPESNHSKSEDCLFINVYTPTLNSSTEELLPVMFWIYGGGFDSGTSTYSMYGPDYLIQEGIVFVSFNYRLGPFGFLSTEDTVIPGNAGLKDQNLALKWTYQNIHLFGGDPKKITIFGESAGSASVTYHLLSDKSAGLFRAAIGQSGTALGEWSLNRNPKDYALKLLYKLAENNNFVVDNRTLTSTKLLEMLRNQTAESISQADAQIDDNIGSTLDVNIAVIFGQNALTNQDNDTCVIFLSQVTVPCLEVPYEDAFLTKSSFELLDAGNFTQVPTILGLNSEEYLILMGNLNNLAYTAATYDQNIEDLIPVDLILANTTDRTEVAEAIKNIYLDSNQLFADNLGAAVKNIGSTLDVNIAVIFGQNALTNQDNDTCVIFLSQVTVPCLEVPYEDAFLTKSSFELLDAGNFTQVPTILGLNSEEYLILMGNLNNLAYTAATYDQNIEDLIPVDLILANTTDRTEVAEAIKNIYLDSNQLFADNLGAAVKYGSDNTMARNIIKYAKLQSKYTNLYFYQFSYHGNLGMMQNYTIDGVLGTVGHAEELPYLFRIVHDSGIIDTSDLSKFSAQDVLVEKRFIKLWTNFAKYLNPTPVASDLLQNITWPVLKSRGFQYLNIGENLEVVKGYPRGNSFHSWNTIYNTYGEKPFYTF